MNEAGRINPLERPALERARNKRHFESVLDPDAFKFDPETIDTERIPWNLQGEARCLVREYNARTEHHVHRLVTHYNPRRKFFIGGTVLGVGVCISSYIAALYGVHPSVSGGSLLVGTAALFITRAYLARLLSRYAEIRKNLAMRAAVALLDGWYSGR